MAVDIALKATVELGEGAKSLKSLKQEFKETQKQLEGLTVGSEKYINTLKKLGAVKDDIGDLNTTIKSFNPEGKIGALTSTIGGVASGFQAATAATALFGSENKELEKTLLKVQASMAFADGIKGVVAMGDAFKVLNAIILANPVTALVVAISALVAGMYVWINSEEDALEIQKQKNIENEIEERRIKGITAAIKERLSVSVNETQRELDLLKARGATAEEIYAKEKQLQNEKEFALMQVRKNQKKFNIETEEEAKNLVHQGEILDAQYIKSQQDKAAKDKEINDKKAKDKREANQKEWEDANAFAEKLSEEETKRAEIDAKKKLDAYNLQQQQIHDAAQSDALFMAAFLNEQAIKEGEIAKKKAADEIQIDKDSNKLRMDSINAVADLTNTVLSIRLSRAKKGSAEEAKLAKQAFDIGKALSLSLATISGIQGVQNAFATASLSPVTAVNPAYPFIAASVAGVLAATNIAKIAATQFNGGGGGGSVTSVSAPSTGSVPTVNAPTQQTTQLSPTGQVINPTEQNQPMRAYVVETDVTRSQQNVSRIQQQATW